LWLWCGFRSDWSRRHHTILVVCRPPHPPLPPLGVHGHEVHLGRLPILSNPNFPFFTPAFLVAVSCSRARARCAGDVIESLPRPGCAFSAFLVAWGRLLFLPKREKYRIILPVKPIWVHARVSYDARGGSRFFPFTPCLVSGGCTIHAARSHTP